MPAAAKSFNRPAVERLLRAHYALVCRIALSLCGRESAGRATVKVVMHQSLRALPTWKNEVDVFNWFLHHTVLKSRDFAVTDLDADSDCLVSRVTKPSPGYAAFVRAFRHLPPQQREAFILFRCERLDPRPAAVAMDCSTTAAANHLIAANKTLAMIAAEDFNVHVGTMSGVYASLTPPDEMILADVGAVSRKLARRVIFKTLRHLLEAALLLAIGWMVWRLWHMVVI